MRRVIEDINPRLGFVIENPTGLLRKLPVYADLDLRSVTYCQYGRSQYKRTDLWLGGPTSETLTLMPMCDAYANDDDPNIVINGTEWKVSKRYKRPCHQAAPRGSGQGIEGQESRLHRTEVPYNLSWVFAEHAERLAGESPYKPPEMGALFDWEDEDALGV